MTEFASTSDPLVPTPPTYMLIRGGGRASGFGFRSLFGPPSVNPVDSTPLHFDLPPNNILDTALSFLEGRGSLPPLFSPDGKTLCIFSDLFLSFLNGTVFQNFSLFVTF